MYCLDCKYDLRDLPESRCPECGREFDVNDPSTYRNRVHRTIIDWFRAGWRKGWIALGILFGLIAIVQTACTELFICKHCAFIGLTNTFDARYIAQAWQSMGGGGPNAPAFDPQAARDYLPPQYDRATAPRIFRQARINLPAWQLLVPLLPYAVVSWLAFRGEDSKRSRNFFALSVGILFCMGALVTYNFVMAYKYPPSYAYLDDFVYLKWDDKTPDDRIVAYTKTPNFRDPDDDRDVIYGNGSISGMSKGILLEDLAKQGDKYEGEP